jgi:hypothetical protein
MSHTVCEALCAGYGLPESPEKRDDRGEGVVTLGGSALPARPPPPGRLPPTCRGRMPVSPDNASARGRSAAWCQEKPVSDLPRACLPLEVREVIAVVVEIALAERRRLVSRVPPQADEVPFPMCVADTGGCS